MITNINQFGSTREITTQLEIITLSINHYVKSLKAILEGYRPYEVEFTYVSLPENDHDITRRIVWATDDEDIVKNIEVEYQAWNVKVTKLPFEE